MIDAYEVQHEGRTYYGNVQLRQFHAFNRAGQWLIANVEDFAVTPTSETMVRRLHVLAAAPGTLVPEPVFAELRQLGLLAGAATRPAGHDTGPRRVLKLVTNLTLLLAQKCNMRCVYCYGEGGEYGDRGLVDKATALKAIDWLIDNSGEAEHLNICFFGGEPLLNFGVLQAAVQYAKARGSERGKKFTFTVTTNGSIVRDDVVDFLRTHDVRPMVSFDGPPEYQDANRPFRNGKGSYRRVRDNVEKLRAAFPDLAARGIVCGTQDPQRVRSAAAEAGFTECSVGIASPVLDRAAPKERGDGRVRRRAVERMIAYKQQLIDEAFVAIRARSVNVRCVPTMLPAILDLCEGKRHHYGCGMGRGLAGISTSGDVYPCHRFIGQADMRMGNIDDYKAEPLNVHGRAVVDVLPDCQTCWARYWCGGGCFYRNKALTGDLHRPDRLDCLERMAQIEGLLHVQSQLEAGDRAYLDKVRRDILRARGVAPRAGVPRKPDTDLRPLMDEHSDGRGGQCRGHFVGHDAPGARG
jgi:uncharacterized protein